MGFIKFMQTFLFSAGVIFNHKTYILYMLKNFRFNNLKLIFVLIVTDYGRRAESSPAE